MWVRILNSRDFTPPKDRRVTYALVAGTEMPIKREWGQLLIKAGDAEKIATPPRAKAST